MINVVMLCSMGASTAMLAKKVRQAADKAGVEMRVAAYPATMANDHVGEADVILLGPQVKYMLADIKRLAGDTPVETIGMQDYGMLRSENVFRQIMGIVG